MESTPEARASQTSQTSPEELAWFDRLAAGDEKALAEIYDRYSRVVFSLASRMLSDPREIEEITQDVFLSLWKNPERYQSRRSSPITWLAAITRNKCIDRLRKAGRRIPAPPDDPRTTRETVTSGREGDPFLAASLGDLAEKIRSCLRRLAGNQRDAVELAYFECLSHTEIADRLTQPPGTVKSRIRLAMDQLRNCMGGLRP